MSLPCGMPRCRWSRSRRREQLLVRASAEALDSRLAALRMGLDTVEYAMAIEEAFGIRLLDAEAERVVTFGDLHQLVLRKLGPVGRAWCLTSTVFYRLRRALVGGLCVQRGDVRPATSVAVLVPAENRRAAWGVLAESLGLGVPALVRPVHLQELIRYTFWSGPIAAVFFALVVARRPAWEHLWGPVAVLIAAAGIGLGLLTLTLTRPWATLVPPGCEDVRGLVTEVVGLNYAKLSPDSSPKCPDDVWAVVVALAADQTGLQPGQIRPEIRIADVMD